MKRCIIFLLGVLALALPLTAAAEDIGQVDFRTFLGSWIWKRWSRLLAGCRCWRVSPANGWHVWPLAKCF